MEEGGIGLCTMKARLFSPESKQTKAIELLPMINQHRPAVKFLHFKVIAQLSAQTLFSLPEKVWVTETKHTYGQQPRSHNPLLAHARAG